MDRHNFTNIPDFRFLIFIIIKLGKDGYDEACLRWHKSLQGFRSYMYMDGHNLLAEDLEIVMTSDRCCTSSPSRSLTSAKINSSKVVRLFATLFDRGFLLKVDFASFVTLSILQFVIQRFPNILIEYCHQTS